VFTTRLVRVATTVLAALVLGAGLFLATPPQPASANPCNYQKQIYCDGGDEPAWQWDGVDDFECVGIPGFAWNGDTADYSGVVGKVYYFSNGGYSLVHDSTPPPPPPPAPAAPAPSTGTKTGSGTGSGTAAQPAPSATPSATAHPEPTATPDVDVDPASVTGTIEVTGELTPGGSISLRGSGFAPHAEFVIEVHSEARTLTTVASDASGDFSTEATIPSDLAPGVHSVVVLVDREEVASERITVIAADSGSETNAAAIWLLGGLAAAAVVALGVYSVLRSRRRRAGAASATAPVTEEATA
jgi:hypothetical protein